MGEVVQRGMKLYDSETGRYLGLAQGEVPSEPVNEAVAPYQSHLSMAELYKLAQDAALTGRSNMDRQELVDGLAALGVVRKG